MPLPHMPRPPKHLPQMRLSLLLGLVVFLLPVAVMAQPGQSEADRQAVIAVIQSQLDAFLADDADGAYQHASPSIQRIFPSPDIFMGMVSTGYLPIYRHQRAEFLEFGIVGGALAQRVLLIGPDGVPVVALYFMQRQPDGSWRINGVSLLDDGGTST